MDYKDIHIGKHIKKISEIRNVSISRICAFLECNHKDILEMYNQKTIDSGILLKWCKLLDYNFFMFYQSHLQLYKPSASTTHLSGKKISKKNKDYVFRKNIYSPDIIDWILEQIHREDLTTKEVIEKYNIPRTTIYRWIKRNKTSQ